jgi:plasmid stabilization system protein ParE
MKVRVSTAPEAREQARIVARWWRANRPTAARLFREELVQALRLLAEAPEIGRIYDHPGIPGLRRLVLQATAYHVYYVYDAARREVIVLAVWSARRGEGPSLRPR